MDTQPTGLGDPQSFAGDARPAQAAVNGSSPHRAYRLTDYKPVLAAAGTLDTQAILVGGQAVYFWASRYSDRFPALEIFLPYTSQDADYLADGHEGSWCSAHAGGRRRWAARGVRYATRSWTAKPSKPQLRMRRTACTEARLCGQQGRCGRSGYRDGPGLRATSCQVYALWNTRAGKLNRTWILVRMMPRG